MIIKNDLIAFIDHDFRFFGASIYLKYLYETLISRFNLVYLIPKEPRIKLTFPYKVYGNNVITIIREMNPKIIYINSMNDEIRTNWELINKYPVIYHSHEKFSSILPDFVVSPYISSLYNDPVQIQPPFFPNHKLNEIFSVKEKINLYSNDPITIGMCGEISDRKEFRLFNLVSKLFPQFNFVWLGGNEDKKMSSNFFIKGYTECPYDYFNSFDYLLFTGKNDPCPYVILENIILNTKIILFKNSILTNLSNVECIIFIDENLSLKSTIKSLILHAKDKRYNDCNHKFGLNYIKTHFTSIQNVIKELEKKSCK